MPVLFIVWSCEKESIRILRSCPTRVASHNLKCTECIGILDPSNGIIEIAWERCVCLQARLIGGTTGVSGLMKIESRRALGKRWKMVLLVRLEGTVGVPRRLGDSVLLGKLGRKCAMATP
jgi:hypothetical protein